jgi:hypothetical protein
MLTEDFKMSFGKLLIHHKLTPTLEGRIRYAETLIQLTEAGLYANDKTDLYKRELHAARQQYGNLTHALQIQGRPEYRESIITRCSNEIGRLLFKIVVKENLALIDERCFETPDQPLQKKKGGVF